MVSYFLSNQGASDHWARDNSFHLLEFASCKLLRVVDSRSWIDLILNQAVAKTELDMYEWSKVEILDEKKK